jgi:Fur family zinc uptake transcriptional regulator
LNTEEVNQAILGAMGQKGWRITAQRKSLARLFASTDRYLSPLDVYETMRNEYTGISYDTVYRNLRLMSEGEHAALEQFHFNESVKFKARCLVHHHHHIICRLCERTYPFDFCPMDKVQGMPAHFAVEYHRFEIYGLCENCQSKIGE